MTEPPPADQLDPATVRRELEHLARELGFSGVGVAGTDLEVEAGQLERWLELEYHGELDYMQRHGSRRWRPAELIDGTVSVISVRMDYLGTEQRGPWEVIEDGALGYVSRYARGRDYHKVLRSRLARLAVRLTERVGPFGYRVFTDSAPVMEKPLARNAGLGWIGKHTNLIDRATGSWFFLGEIYTDLALPPDPPTETDHCGSCTRCIEACPTGAIVAPYLLDARRCISYLTIELKGPIPEPLRPLIGNRIFGCDDCQLVCPWNRYAQPSAEADFAPRHGLDAPDLIELLGWDSETFETRTRGSAIRRLSFDQWQRNLAVALGNAPPDPARLQALRRGRERAGPLAREHIDWAIARQQAALAATPAEPRSVDNHA